MSQTTCEACGTTLRVRVLPSGRKATEWHDCSALPPITDEDRARFRELLRQVPDCGEGG